MNRTKNIIAFCFLFIIVCFNAHATVAQDRSTEASVAIVSDDELKAELDALINLPPAERIEKLKAFIEAHPQSALKARALELLVSAHASLGDEKLKAGDAMGGTEQFRLAVAASPADMSDKLFASVVSQLPTNLFLRGERSGSVEIARLIEAKVKDDPKRLIKLAVFYVGSEEADEAARISEVVIKLAPDMAIAYQALGAAHRLALRLDGAAAAYARALELDPQSTGARQSLADLRRASGKSEEALALYRELLKIDAAGKAARAGAVLSLFDLGRRDEAERELDAAIKDDPRNLALLVGAAYWYAAQNDATRAVDLGQRAVEIEPRYTWAQIALARALLAQKRPLDAEQALRVAKRYGQFPTLDYELATTLATAGLYEEASVELTRSFKLRGDQIETRLAGRNTARAANFAELLAPERRAGIFQMNAADSETNARMLKGLLAFHAAMNPAGGRASIKEVEVLSAAQGFIAGDDAMRAYRQLYVASRLLKSNIALPTVLELTEAAASGIEAALDAPAAPVAVWADELRDLRARAAQAGQPLTIVGFERSVLANILRGRIEDISGWALYHQDKVSEAITRLRRAVSILPENQILWRTALWHLGAALDVGGQDQEALAAYIKSYQGGEPDPARRAIIEALYRKIKGSLDGLAAQLSARSAPATKTTAASASAAVTNAPAPLATPTASVTTKTKSSDDLNAPISTPTPAPTTTSPTPPELPSPAPTVSSGSAEPQKAETSEPLPTSTPPPAAPGKSNAEQKEGAPVCAIYVSESSLKVRRNGGSAVIIVRLEGQSDSATVTPTTTDWPDIAVFAESNASTTESGSFKYSITSISKKTGAYTIKFNSPCGSKIVTVTVE